MRPVTMSSKKKNTKSDWFDCQNCDILLRAKNLEQHHRECKGKSPLAPTAADETKLDKHHILNEIIPYPRIVNGILFGEISHHVDKGVTRLPKAAKTDLIQLNPETMTRCGLCIGQPALLATLDPCARQFVCIAWPVQNFPIASIGVHPSLQKLYGLRGDALLKVEAISGTVTPASTANLFARPDQEAPFMDSPEFQNFVARSLNSKYILCGSLFSVSYYGKPVTLEVGEITSKSGSKPSELDQSSIRMQSTDQSLTNSQSVDQSQHSQARGIALRDACSTSVQLERTDVTISSFTEHQTNTSESVADSNHLSSGQWISKLGDLSDSSIIVGTVTSECSLLDSSSEFEHQFKMLDLSEASSVVASSTPRRNASTEHRQKPLDYGVLSVSQFAAEESGVYRITKSTELRMVSGAQDGQSKEEQMIAKLGGHVTYDMIGGMERQLKAVKDMVVMPLKNPEIFRSLGIPPPRGVLLYGPPGVGKTMLARAVACETRVHSVIVNGPEVLSKYYGESEARLRDLFTEASQHAPSLILIDELDALCPHRERVNSELEKRVVSMLLTLMDGMVQTGSSGGHVLILGATSRPDSIDPALRRPGRFDREIEIGVPNAGERGQILRKHVAGMSHGLSTEDIGQIAQSAHGYVGADLAAMCKEAAMHAFERLQSASSDGIQDGWSASGLVTRDDFQHALTQVKPSALREVEIDIPKVYWSDIGGLESVKLKLRQAVEWPIKHPEAFARLGISPPKGVLMYGPPGCSKTLIAKALATESGLNFIAVKGPELFSKWVGESERAVREVFRKARSAAPAIVFFDEIDGLAVERGSSSGGSNVGDRVLGQLLTELDGVEGLRDVVIVAATNRPDMIDKALMRPGRLDRILYVSLPDDHARQEIFHIHFRSMPVANDCSVEQLVKQTQGYSGAEVVAVCREAALAAMQESLDIQAVGQRHFDQALNNVKPQTSEDSIKFYEDYQKKSGLHTV